MTFAGSISDIAFVANIKRLVSARLFNRNGTHQLREGQVLEYTAPQPWQGIRFVRIETTSSPSWVSWHEVQVIGTSH